MIDRILQAYNMQSAYRQVRKNKGSAGVDDITVEQLEAVVRKDYPRIKEEILSGKYYPQPILGVEIPKSNGKTRMLGIPTTTDRMLQQAVSQVLMMHWEQGFSANSYGFRPKRNARQAVGRALGYINEGYKYIVDIDLKTFFDEVDHCLLLNLIYQRVKCPITLGLIRRWLRAPIRINGKLHKRRKGVPQGSPLSPLLSNILLNELDKELERRGLLFVRYADDFSIYVKSRSRAETSLKAIERYLKIKLKLTINKAKSGKRRPMNFELLGFGFSPIFKKGRKGKYQAVVAKKSWEKLKQRLKWITRKTKPLTFAERIAQITRVQRGWLNYFRGTAIIGKLRNIDGWLRNRLRYCIWKSWKKPKRRSKNLLRLGASPRDARRWGYSRKGGWAIAQSPILKYTITPERLRKRGYVSLSEVYVQLNP